MKRRRWFELHSWIGIITGLMMFLICWSGTVAVLAHEIDWLLDARLRVEPATVPHDWSLWAQSIRSAYPEASSITLHAPMFSGAAAQAVLDTPTQSMLRVYLDPATGSIVGESSYFNVQRFFRSLHMSLFDLGSDRTWGYWLVAALAPLLLLTSLAPLLFYRRWWRGFFTLKRHRGARVFWSDFHKLSGVWALVFTWLMALTGIWYLAEWFGADFDYPEREPVQWVSGEASLPLDALMAQAGKAWPALDVTAVTLPEGSYWGPVLYVEGQADGVLVRPRANYMMLDPATGDTVRRQDIVELGWPARWVDTVDPLHFGNFAGLGVKLIWFALGLLLSGLCLTGAYLHAQRLHTQAHASRHGWPGTLAAACLTFVVLAFAVWGGAKEILQFGPLVDGRHSWPDVPMAVASFLAGWSMLTLALMVGWVYLVRPAAGKAASITPAIESHSKPARKNFKPLSSTTRNSSP